MIQSIAVSMEQSTSLSTEQSMCVLQSNAQANDSQHLQGGKKESKWFSEILTKYHESDVALRERRDKKGQQCC